MRREITDKERYPNIHKHFAILPFLCKKCNNVVWLENQYWANVGPYCGGHGHIEEVCCKCFPERKDADDFFFAKNKPTTPPPPSTRIVKNH